MEGLSTIIADIGTFFTGAIGWVGEALEVVVSTPALFLLVIALPLSGFAIGLLNRMFKLG